MVYRWISAGCAALAVAGFGLAESYRREAHELRVQLEKTSQSAKNSSIPAVASRAEASTVPRLAPETRDERAPDGIGEPPETSPKMALASTTNSMDLVLELERTTDDAQRRQLIDRLLRDPSPAIRLAAAAELLQLSPGEGVAAVRDLVASLDPDARTNSWGTAELAILALAKVEGNDASGDLYSYFESDERMLQIPAARALELRGDPSPVQDLVRKLSRNATTGEGAARIRALTDLGRTRSPTAIPTLASALADPNASIRLRAVQSLEAIEAIDSVLALEKVLQDPSPNVRDAAQSAIERLRQRLRM